MRITYKKGNIFNTKCQTVVNTVNCVGVMGKGIALVYKLRYPKMYDLYKIYCNTKAIAIGKLWLYVGESDAPWVLNFPTKFHWKYPSKIEYIEKGLQKFIGTYKQKGITSIAFPLLGTHNGELDKEEVKELMNRYLKECDIPIEIYEYDPAAPDDLFHNFKLKWNKLSTTETKDATGIRKDRIEKINTALADENVKSMIILINYKGIGLVTMEKCYQFVMKGNVQA